MLEITRDMVTHARSLVDDVEFSAEDALRSDYNFLSEVRVGVMSSSRSNRMYEGRLQCDAVWSDAMQMYSRCSSVPWLAVAVGDFVLGFVCHRCGYPLVSPLLLVPSCPHPRSDLGKLHALWRADRFTIVVKRGVSRLNVMPIKLSRENGHGVLLWFI